MALAPLVVHIAAPPVGWTQTCAACGTVLLDNSAWGDGRVAVPEGTDAEPVWWPVGERIATDKTPERTASITYVIEAGRPLDDDERLCAGAN